MSQHVSTKLKRVCVRGSKGKVLTSAEIYRAKVSFYYNSDNNTVYLSFFFFLGSTI